VHPLDKLWNSVRFILEKVWPNGPTIDLDAVEKVILQFHNLDLTSEAFRYPVDRKDNATLILRFFVSTSGIRATAATHLPTNSNLRPVALASPRSESTARWFCKSNPSMPLVSKRSINPLVTMVLYSILPCSAISAKPNGLPSPPCP
jgi:hypothetical protein